MPLSGDESSQAPAEAIPLDSDSIKTTLPEAIRKAEKLRAEYEAKAGRQMSIPRYIGAALIPLSAIALYRGVISPGSEQSQNRLAAAGLLGSAAYVYGNTYTSKANADVYAEGEFQLDCAISLSSMIHGYSSEQLKTMRTDADRLDVQADVLGHRISALDLAIKGGSQQSGIPAKKLPRHCSQPSPCSTLKSSDARRVCEVQASRREKSCKVFSPPQADFSGLDALISEARNVQTQAGYISSDIFLMLRDVDNAGEQLKRVTNRIQDSVQKKIRDKEPSLADVVAAMQSLRGTALQLTGDARFAPPPATAEASHEGRLQGKLPLAEIKALRDEIDNTRAQSVRLDRWRQQAVQLRKQADAGCRVDRVYGHPLNDAVGIAAVPPPPDGGVLVSSQELDRVHANLCVPRQGEGLSQPLRSAISAFQAGNGLPQTDKSLDQATLQKILAMPKPDCQYFKP